MTDTVPDLTRLASLERQAERERARHYTLGEWATEAGSAAALDTVLDGSGLWTVYREVPGTYAQPRPIQDDKNPRIDRVLVPTKRLIMLGWCRGVIGIEIKKSGTKIGPIISQALDYSRAVWSLPSGGIRVWLDWVFIWPMPEQLRTVGSILSQNCIGSASYDDNSRLLLKAGGQTVLRLRRAGEVEIGDTTNGRKVGSR